MRFYQKIIISTGFFLFLGITDGTASAIFRKKKPKSTATPSVYKQLTGRDSVQMLGVMNALQKGDTFYLEFPTKYLGREFLITNKLQKVPLELNEAGVNKGINYENQSVKFEWDKAQNRILIRQQRLTPEYPEHSAISRSVRDNYIDPLIAALKVECAAADSSTVIFKVNDLFNGKQNCLNDVFNLINIGTSADGDLSRIISVKSFENSVVAHSELTTVVHEGNSKVNVTIEVSSALTLLPETLMSRRKENPRVGYFTTSRTRYDDEQQAVKRTNYITRWRLVPQDKAAYLRGELTEPVKPIVFYIDQAVPMRLRSYIRKGITDWNIAFERAGFKNAIRTEDFTDSLEVHGDDMKFSVLTYDASEKANAMGPSVLDPRTGEILEADIIWWHNVQSLIREWIMVQTSATDVRARSLDLPDELMGDAIRFVACHEVGHSLGLRHNMIASAAYPTDSLRSQAFTERVKGTSSSIMDYARFNYIAQPGDDVRVMSPNIGPYDLMAIEWGYRWYPEDVDEEKELHALLEKYKGPLYRYSEAQDQRAAIDPRALSEDLGDDGVKSAKYGIANLKRIVPHIVDWTRTGEVGQSYDEAAKFYSAIISQWGLYLYHVMANIGGMYIERTTLDDNGKAFTFVEKERQKEALKFLLEEALTYPKWLFDTPLSQQTYLHRSTPLGITEQDPNFVLRNQQNYILWDLLTNERLVRMYENEWQNGKKAFTAVEMMDMLHRHFFKKTVSGMPLNVMERSLQKSFVDALITAAAESEGVKINKKMTDQSLSTARRTIEHTSGQVSRNSDAISVKRGELLRILQLLKKQRNTGDLATQMHYNDVILRVQTALGFQK
ncbi:MAG: zinc-dependent metalloprotease [Prevotella sp.]|nr:zinc-dependent metalloprotease [Prevotella sp.]